jgi:zinc protease
VDRVRADATLAANATLVLEDRVELPRLYISWHSPAMFASDDAELDIVADVLTHGKTSRLYKSLVYERRIATDVSAYQHSREIGGLFQIASTASAGVSLTELHTAILTAVVELGTNGPTEAELERGLTQTEAQFIYRLQTVGGFGGKGDQLNAYNTFAGDPGYFDRDRQRYFDVTSKAAAAAVNKWLVHAPCVSLSVVPKGRRDLALPEAQEVHVS